MSDSESLIFVSRYKTLSRTLSLFLIALGAMTLFAWGLRVPILQSLSTGLVSMKANTAAGVFCAGWALLLLNRNRICAPSRCVISIFSVLIFFIGAATLLQYFLGRDFGIDQCLFKEAAGAFGTSNPGRMSPNSCVILMLAGLALFFFDVRLGKAFYPSQILFAVCGVISFMGFIGYLYGIKALYGLASFTLMSFSTTVAFLILCFAGLTARPDRGFFRIFILTNPGGLLARRFTGVVLALPLLAEWAVELGSRAGFYDASFKPALHTMILIPAFLYLIFVTARLLSQIDDLRIYVEDRIAQSEEKYRQLVEDANSIILRMDVRGTITYMNHFGLKFFGFSGDELIGKNCLGTIMAGTDASGRDLSAMMEQITAEPEHYVNNNNENTLRNGQKVWISWTNRALYGPDGKLREVFCVGNDITGIKEAEKAMAKAKDAAESANRAKSTFLATMSHELRTPLTVVMGYSELLGEGVAGAMSDKQKEYCRHIYDSGKHLLSLINDILDLSKVEAGKMDLELSNFDLKEVLGKCLVLLGDSAKKRGIEFLENIDPAVGIVTADERKVRQVLFNLLSNAVKFTPDRGKIELCAKKIDGGMILITVADSGIGIDPKDADKVFEEFKQIDNEYSRKYAGTGLGMPLSKKFVELHGGKIWFESEGKGQGTRFHVTLPEKAVKVITD